MTSIDDIHYPPPKPPSLNVIGGAGSYAISGARLFRTPPLSKNLGWTIHKGYDFPTELQTALDRWQTSCHWIDTPKRKTTRGWNGYGDDEQRDFKYLTEKLRIDETQLTPDMLGARVFHLICSARRCISLVTGIRQARRSLGNLSDPRYIWEPVPDNTGPDELQNIKNALQHVDVVSPNHHELANLFSDHASQRSAESDALTMQQRCEELLACIGSEQGAVVVRCGERGCLCVTRRGRFRLPAVFEVKDAERVVDPTGAGNAFLGGFAIGLLESPDQQVAIVNGCIYGSVAASFAVEQVGLPHLTEEGNGERWNGESVEERLYNFRQRVQHVFPER